MPNFLGIDYGAKRIGVALGTSDIRIARPLTTLTSDHSIPQQLHQLALQYDVEAVVLGRPRGLEGQDTDQTREVERFAEALTALGLEVRLQDEAVTSELAQERIGQNGRAADVDQEAATIILQDFLNEY